MGLDMYLERVIHLSNFDFDEEGKALSAAVMTVLGIPADKQAHYANESIEITLPEGYWRKANAVHKWFVDNVQDGEDDCRSQDVYEPQLEELRSLCKQILADPGLGPTLLPAQKGFFFGCTDYDGYYLDDLRNTVRIIDHALDPANTVGKRNYFKYQSSW